MTAKYLTEVVEAANSSLAELEAAGVPASRACTSPFAHPVQPAVPNHGYYTATTSHLSRRDQLYQRSQCVSIDNVCLADVYSFDELPEAQISAIYKVFGPVKTALPQLQTMATLPDGRQFNRTDWTRLPPGLPLDIWVDCYNQVYDAAKLAAVAEWKAAGHEYFWYWGISPHKAEWLNTFVERPAIQGRLLLWLASLHEIRGLLYYEVALSLKFHSTPLTRLNGTMLTDFSPASWPDGQPGAANGDGNFLYPCPSGPCASIRLKNIRDGIEDWELLDRLPIAVRTPLIRQLVRNGTERTEDPLLLERVRRQAAQLVMQQQMEEEEEEEDEALSAA